MVGRGWIGTSAPQTEVLAPYLKDALAGKRTLVLAVETQSSTDPDDDDDVDEDPPSRMKGPTKPRYPGTKRKVIQI